MKWRDVLRVLPDDDSRSYAMRLYRDAGFTANCFASKTKAREAMGEALIRTEDWLEIRYPRRDRTAIRNVRRRLEVTD